ncbi:MAG: hypothetical protein PHN82_07425 [bacterium]|nr:hypothetical protein [bacterium]
MRTAILAALAAATALLAASCGTPYRYEYYDYGGPTIDEKNKERGDLIDRSFRGLGRASGGTRRWRR